MKCGRSVTLFQPKGPHRSSYGAAGAALAPKPRPDAVVITFVGFKAGELD